MKKIVFFLIIALSVLLNINTINVNAEQAAFYEGEYIRGIWMNKKNPYDNLTYYQTARFFRKQGTNEFAYCIEPFNFFNENGSYQTTITPSNLTNEQKEKIKKIAHFGYGYKNHTEEKWYAITQMMIWMESDKNGDYYFTDSLNGNRVSYYQDEMNEINSLVSSYNITPSFSNKSFNIVENKSLELEDTNNVISLFTSTDNNLKINNNKLSISNLKEGNYNFNLTKQDNYYNKPIIFYQSENSQNLVETGNLDDLIINLNVNVYKTSLTINKLDKTTQNNIPLGDASLDNAKYDIYDSNNNIITTLTIKDTKASIDNLDFGTYKIKEKEAGKGYKLDNEEYIIEISKDNNIIVKDLYNEVISSELIINKEYGDGNTFNKEQDVLFEIYNSKGKLVDKIKTNEDGIAKTTLVFGKYEIRQKTTKEGYSINKPFTIDIDSEDDKTINLKDLKIKVPNTHTEDILSLIIKLVLVVLS